jgi:nitrogen fixation protein FixH
MNAQEKTSRWPWFLGGLLGVNVVVVATTIFYAVSDPSVAIEPQYYQKAQAWDQSKEAQAASDALGWSLSMAATAPGESGGFSLVLHDRDGVAIDDAAVMCEAFHHARSGDRTLVKATPRENGTYDISVRPFRPGTWQLRVQALRGADAFLKTMDVKVAGSVAAPEAP